MKNIITLFVLVLTISVATGQKATNYLCFTSHKTGSSVAVIAEGDAKMPQLEYSFNQKKWFSYNTVDDCIKIPSAKKKQKPCVYFRGRNTKGISFNQDDYIRFIIDGEVSASGSIMSIIDGNGSSKKIPCDYCFYKLFYDNPGLLSMPELPANTLKEGCYANMFERCFGLTETGALPAKTLTPECYREMFLDCANLKSMEPLLADKMARECYASMFEGCINLVRIPGKLPALGLDEGCYRAMFKNCQKITKAPYLPSPTMVEMCYANMFEGCQSLEYIRVATIKWDRYKCTSWVKGVSPKGKFECPKILPEETGENRIPEGWDIEKY